MGQTDEPMSALAADAQYPASYSNSKKARTSSKPAVTAAPEAGPGYEEPIPIISTVKELEKLLNTLGAQAHAKEEVLNNFRTRLLGDKAAIRSIAQFGDVPASHVKKKNKFIRTPGSRLLTDSELDELGRKSLFTCPAHYVKHCVHKDYVQPLRLSNGDLVFYDLSKEDLIFIEDLARTLNQDIEATFSTALEENFLRLIDQFEHNTGLGSPISTDAAITIAQSMQCVASSLPLWTIRAIYKHWLDRRNALQKPLLRCYWVTPPQNVPSAFHVFRTKITNRERMSLRRPRRSLQDAAQKMDYILADLKRVDKILRQMIKRDRQKMLLSELNTCIFDQMRHEAIDPTYVNPHWKYLKSSFFSSLLRESEASKTETIDKWLDDFMETSALRTEPPGALPAVAEIQDADLEPLAISWGRGKSVPGKPAVVIDVPIPNLTNQFMCTLRGDFTGSIWVDNLSAVDYKDSDVDLVLPLKLLDGTLDSVSNECDVSDEVFHQHASKFALVHNRTLDPVPHSATLGAVLSRDTMNLHGLKQLRFLRALAQVACTRALPAPSACGEGVSSAPTSFKIAGLTGGIK
eukprot:Gregarina_sp_Poly_1__2580@NODE_16_length_22882_cov_82_653956_g14_i0_p4_GENE_NODE_16_length_22882_cov_82_653956_g14_i0NODE_16_length_22882_cov_82_653956_g14_i0_p4_ORF_typecomplete_len576_score59_56VSNARE_C/PF12352_8/0_17_NODE_16_length_22882_cov_82_653956_g14_i01490016627